MSFGYKHGLPRDVDLVFDCRFIPNPHWIPDLRPLTGLDEPVRDNVMAQRGTIEFIEHLRDLLGFLLPAYVAEGKSYLSIGIGCTGGRHRSVVLGIVLVEHQGDLAIFGEDVHEVGFQAAAAIDLARGRQLGIVDVDRALGKTIDAGVIGARLTVGNLGTDERRHEQLPAREALGITDRTDGAIELIALPRSTGRHRHGHHDECHILGVAQFRVALFAQRASAGSVAHRF